MLRPARFAEPQNQRQPPRWRDQATRLLRRWEDSEPQTQSIAIRQSVGVIEIRRATASDVDALHALRLEALAESPRSFGSTYAIEVQRDPATRRSWVTD